MWLLFHMLGRAVSTKPKQYPWLHQRNFLFTGDPLSEWRGQPRRTADPAAVLEFVEAHRWHGYRCATLDPLGAALRADDAHLSPERFELFAGDALREEDIQRFGVSDVAALDRWVKATYCGAWALDCSALRDTARAAWLFAQWESAEATPPTPAERLRLLDRLTQVQAWEAHAAQCHPHGKRFSLEGCEALIPLLDQLVAQAAGQGVQEVVLGMAHRGRVNVLVNLLGMPAAEVLDYIAATPEHPERQCDLIYHLGREHTVQTADGPVHLTLAYNPSHLQSVFPVAGGMAHAVAAGRGLFVSLHGDAAFAGQGVVMETLMLTQREGYDLGGAVHVVVNNQVGFTALNPMDARTPRYCTDITRMIDAPVLRVSAEAPELVLRAANLALAYRARFHADVVIDLVGYRRGGHSEHDAQAVTRPLLATQAEARPTPAALYATQLADAGLARPAELAARIQSCQQAVVAAWPAPAPTPAPQPVMPHLHPLNIPPTVTQMQAWLRTLCALPAGFVLHPAVQTVRDHWLQAAGVEQAPVDWCLAENLAYASLLSAGVPVRVSGMDVQRGTFMHRHAVWHDQALADRYVPLRQLVGAAAFDVINSPLAEEAVLGFEYGRSVRDPATLAIWEAQFGDFVNEAQVYLDQYISSGQAKWGQTSALAVFLPHGYEGNGPEHSTGYISRFLLLCGDENLRLVCPSTAAQWFHLLRRQALDPVRKPLIAMTPKGQLYGEALSHTTLQALAEGEFQPLLGDDAAVGSPTVTRAVLCSGKFYYDLLRARQDLEAEEVALWRLEQLYPFPRRALEQQLRAQPGLKELVWAQEEHLNQGAWQGVRDELARACETVGVRLRQVARRTNAAGATPSTVVHRREQRELAFSALSEIPT